MIIIIDFLVNNEEIKTMKIVIRNELNKRKQLKDKMAHMEKIRTTMSDALEKYIKQIMHSVLF